MNKYVKKAAFMIPYVKGYYEEIERYRSEIGHLCSEIEGLRSAEIRYYSCWQIETFNLRFIGHIDTGEKCMGFCCRNYIDFPRVALCETPEQSVNSIIELRAAIIAESIRFSLLGRYAEGEKRVFTSECVKCASYQQYNWGGGGGGLIHYITFGMIPSPCQCKCIYCNVPKDVSRRQINEESMESYEKVFAIIDWVQKNGMTARDLTWDVMPGEITIHPFRDRIFSLVKDQTAHFFTNGFIFDERIASNLSANRQSLIDFSIDCGTSQTWYKVKGVDNFNTVIENFTKYLASGVRPEQIEVKYIVLPGINDNMEDYQSMIKIVKERLKICSIIIAVDTHIKKRESFIKPAGYLLAMLRRNNMTSSFYMNIFQDEIEKISTFADELLESGGV